MTNSLNAKIHATGLTIDPPELYNPRGGYQIVLVPVSVTNMGTHGAYDTMLRNLKVYERQSRVYEQRHYDSMIADAKIIRAIGRCAFVTGLALSGGPVPAWVSNLQHIARAKGRIVLTQWVG